MASSILALTKSTGGLALYHRLLLDGLDRDRFKVHTLCLSENGAVFAAELAAEGHSAEPVAMARYAIDPGGDARVLRRTVGLVRQRGVGVILCHGSKAGFIGRLAGRICGVPAVYCQASLPFLRRVQGGKAPVYWALEFAARGIGGHIVALTEQGRQSTLAHHLSAPQGIEVISTGIDTEKFRPRGRRDALVAAMGLDPTRPVVGWIGRLERQKAPEDYLAALEHAARTRPEAQFVIAGEGRQRAAVAARIAATGLGAAVRLLPWQDDPARFFEALDIFALSSRWEGLPLTLLEAMASGAVPVSTDVDGCAEVIEDSVSGRLVPAGDPLRMASALHELLADPARRSEMAVAARLRIEARFDRRQMIANWAGLLERLVARKPREGAG